MFLMIENDGVAPVQSFTVLGLSSARGNATKIGQFGSGSKHGILTCMRQGVSPTIFLGQEQLKFATTTDKMGDKVFEQLLYEFKGEIRELPIALEFGALDWNGLDMGLREFVSNAIDAGGHKVEVCSAAEPSPNKTRIFLPFSPDVSKFFSELRNKFLHFSPEFNPAQTIIPKTEQSVGRFYRKGVFIREAKYNSCYDYNFGDNVKIDESRNMDDWTVKNHAARLWELATLPEIEDFLRKASTFTEKVFEYHLILSHWYCGVKNPTSNWLKAWKTVYGDAVCGNAKTQGQLIAKAVNKGIAVVDIPASLLDFLITCGVPSVNTKLDNVDRLGREVKPANISIVQKVVKIWEKLEKLGVTNGKSMPKVNTFVYLMDGQEQTHGFYNHDDMSINLEVSYISSKCILEELAHHITGANDNSRDFQDYFIKLCAMLLKV